MAGKSAGVQNDIAVALRLPSELHQQLKAAAAGRSLSAEVRRRLVASLDGDTTTRNLIDGICNIVHGARLLTGRSWHEDQATFLVFEQAIYRLLDNYRPTPQ